MAARAAAGPAVRAMPSHALDLVVDEHRNEVTSLMGIQTRPLGPAFILSKCSLKCLRRGASSFHCLPSTAMITCCGPLLRERRFAAPHLTWRLADVLGPLPTECLVRSAWRCAPSDADQLAFLASGPDVGKSLFNRLARPASQCTPGALRADQGRVRTVQLSLSRTVQLAQVVRLRHRS